MPPSSSRRRGAPTGNMNNFKHGFYSRRIRKRDIHGVESTDSAGLLEEIALIRVYTRRLIEAFDPSGDFYDYADLLRILCIASAAITRVLRAHYLINPGDSAVPDEIAEAILQVNAELRNRLSATPSPIGPPIAGPSGDSASIISTEQSH